MKLSQKKIAVLGDSITAGCGVADPANLYWRLLSTHNDAVCYAEAAGYAVVGKSVIIGSSADSLPELQCLAIDWEYRGNADVILATDPPGSPKI